MKYYIALLFLVLLILFSCKDEISGQKKEQDSLFAVLHTQIELLKKLPKVEKKEFSLSDSLSSIDSLLFQNLFFNYRQSLNVMDSIHNVLKSTASECDALNKYADIQDTAIARRLQYLINIHQNYIQEYYKSAAIAEQNKILLQMFNKNAR